MVNRVYFKLETLAIWALCPSYCSKIVSEQPGQQEEPAQLSSEVQECLWTKLESISRKESHTTEVSRRGQNKVPQMEDRFWETFTTLNSTERWPAKPVDFRVSSLRADREDTYMGKNNLHCVKHLWKSVFWECGTDVDQMSPQTSNSHFSFL